MFDFFNKKTNWPSMKFEEMKKRARILVIDDKPFAYSKLFKNDGYNIEKWDDIKDLPKLETGYYDVILLDIQGVGTKQSVDQGFGILRHLRRENPSQIIVAYSNADFSLKYQEFFKQADDTLEKTQDYVEFKQTVDRFLKERFSISFYINRVATLANSQISDVPKLRRLTERAILGGSTNKLKTFLEANTDKTEITSSVLKITAVAIELVKILLTP
jgi:CheY-like chemotaxis protein